LIHYFGLLKKILVYQSRTCTATKILSKNEAPSLSISSKRNYKFRDHPERENAV
jgi:hypothetical protein